MIPTLAPPSDPRPAGRGSEPALRVRGLTKVYDGTVALGGVDLAVARGEIHGLLGENGAGKSTLIKVVAGIETADAGEVELFGRPMPPRHGPADVARAGCAFIHQTSALIADFTVAENIAMVAGYPRRRGRILWSAVRRDARLALARLGVEMEVDTTVAELPPASQAIVAIARAIALDARLIVLDEPTASLHRAEVQALFSTLRRLRADGVACILISHRIDDVLAVCDRVTVMRDGRVAAQRDVATLDQRQLTALIVGRELAPETHDAPLTSGPARARVDQLRTVGAGPVSFGVCEGQIVGLTGLADAGHQAIGEALFSLQPIVAGSATVEGRPYAPRDIADALSRGVGYLPSDRATAGAALTMTLRENLFLNPRRSGVSLLRASRERASAQVLLELFGVRPADPEREVATLSGGNQQKLLLAKWVATRPRLLVLSEPTGAVDIGARADIYRLLRRACQDDGLSVLLISSDFEEIAQVCDHAVVLSQGRVAQELRGDDITVAAVTRAAYAGGR